MRQPLFRRLFTWALVPLLVLPVLAQAAKVEGTGKFEIPSWFKPSFLDLAEDVKEARAANKRVMVYFHQDGCPYCSELVNNNFSQKDIVDYIRKHFDALEINMWGDREVTDLSGHSLPEKQFAAAQKVWFTPTVLFFDESGKTVLRINGYYPPKRFLAALHYVAERKEKTTSFPDFMAGKVKTATSGKLHPEPFYLPPPYDLSKLVRQGPVAVFFEQKDCPACDRLHQNVFAQSETLEQLKRYRVVQLDMWANTPLVTPGGRRSTARQWARKLGISYAPSAVFFIDGKEVIRIEAFLKAFHVQSVMDYAASGAYRTQPSLQRFIQSRADRLLKEGKQVDLWK